MIQKGGKNMKVQCIKCKKMIDLDDTTTPFEGEEEYLCNECFDDE